MYFIYILGFITNNNYLGFEPDARWKQNVVTRRIKTLGQPWVSAGIFGSKKRRKEIFKLLARGLTRIPKAKTKVLKATKC